MFLGRVVGRLWAARQAEGLNGRKLLLVRPEGVRGGEPSSPLITGHEGSTRLVVVVDGLTAGPGDRVLVAHGSRVRDLTVGEAVADKDVVIAIVDGAALDGEPARAPTAAAARGRGA